MMGGACMPYGKRCRWEWQGDRNCCSHTYPTLENSHTPPHCHLETEHQQECEPQLTPLQNVVPAVHNNGYVLYLHPPPPLQPPPPPTFQPSPHLSTILFPPPFNHPFNNSPPHPPTTQPCNYLHPGQGRGVIWRPLLDAKSPCRFYLQPEQGRPLFSKAGR
jgi:hypothetical protein